MRSNLSSSQKETEESSGGRSEAERKGKQRERKGEREERQGGGKGRKEKRNSSMTLKR